MVNVVLVFEIFETFGIGNIFELFEMWTDRPIPIHRIENIWGSLLRVYVFVYVYKASRGTCRSPLYVTTTRWPHVLLGRRKYKLDKFTDNRMRFSFLWIIRIFSQTNERNESKWIRNRVCCLINSHFSHDAAWSRYHFQRRYDFQEFDNIKLNVMNKIGQPYWWSIAAYFVACLWIGVYLIYGRYATRS